MNADDTTLLGRMLAAQPLAALATLHGGEPAVSMVPFALLPPDGGDDGTAAFVLHVSALAAHTRDLLAHPGVGLMVMSPFTAEAPPLALPRLTLQGTAVPLEEGDASYPIARAAYLRRLPDSEPMFGFGDFRLVAVRPRALRLVAGFGRAMAVPAADFAAVVRALSDGG